MKEVNFFISSSSNIKEMITYFKVKNHKSKNNYKKNKTLNTILESVDTVVNIGATSTTLILPVTSVSLVMVPFSAGIGCALLLGKKVM